jgi:hypothetical protein
MFRPINDHNRATNQKSRRKVKYNASMFTVWGLVSSQICLFLVLYETQKYRLWKNVKTVILNEVLHIFTTVL